MPVKLLQIPADFRFEAVPDDDKFRELEARRPGVEDEDCVAIATVAISRRWCAISAATALEARRLCTKSTRLVSVIGTRAPRTTPAESASR
jgi:hypothetical protein